MEKRCPKCETTKPHSEWGKNRGNKDGLQGWCKPCMSQTVGDFHKRRLAVVRSRMLLVEPGTEAARDLAQYILDGPNLSYYKDVDAFCSYELEDEW